MIARVLSAIADDGRSLNDENTRIDQELSGERDRAFARACVYGTLRDYYALEHWLSQLLDRPLRRKERELRSLMLAALYQLHAMEVPAHALVSEHVEAARALGKSWATGLVNAVLRRALEAGHPPPSDDETVRLGHPRWLINALRESWPDDYLSLLAENLRQAPLTLRVNRRRTSRADYLVRLRETGLDARALPHADDALVLEQAVPVTQLPGFDDGLVSVQDAAAQLAAPLLAPGPNDRVLDACAAPGGKTTHLIELAPTAHVVALDRDPERLSAVSRNLERLGQRCEILAADAADTDTWAEGRRFDRILLDAPCSASGVIRRHPDIRLHRTAQDVEQLVSEQQRLLDALWPLLELGGRLLYATCSVLSSENDDQIAAFVQRHPDAHLETLPASWGHTRRAGRQILPGEDEMDGFFYALLTRRRES